MDNQRIFSNNFILRQRQSLKDNLGVDAYLEDKFTDYKEEDVLINPRIQVVRGVDFVFPDEEGNHDVENAKLLFDAYKQLTPTQATDIRLWTYLSHVPFWEYMKKRRPIEAQAKEKKADYILTHWFVDGLSPRTLSRNDLALFWWGSFLTYDFQRDNPYELTEELFSMLDFTRTLIEGTQGRHKIFIHTLLEFVINNHQLFKQNKQSKIRFLMREMNKYGGYKIIPTLTKEEITKILEGHRNQLLHFSN